MKALYLLEAALRRSVPAALSVAREMSIVLSERQRPEPDLVVITTEEGGGDTWYPADAVLLAVEIVSPESQDRDRRRKPRLYAEAGIRHFWRVEENDGLPVVYVYELDEAIPSYTPTVIFHDRMKLAVPFDLDVDLNSIAEL
jgi:Uma2 family endonuclease